MTKYIIRRFLQAIPIFFGITILSYSIMVLAPGDPVSILSFDPSSSAETREALTRRLGVGDPLPLQYLRWLIGDDWMIVDKETWYKVRLEDGSEGWLSDMMVSLDEQTGELQLRASRQPYRSAAGESAEIIGRVSRRDSLEVLETTNLRIWGESRGIIRGDFGQSFQYKQPPLKLIFERFPASFELNVSVILFGLILGWIIGVLSAVWRGSWFDQFSRVLSVVGDAVPIFWLSFLVILVFAAPGLDWLPMGDRCTYQRGGCPPIWMRLEYLILPTIVLGLGGIAGWSRYIRAAMLDNINSDYVRTAKSKGLPARAIWFKHALRNAIIPMATFLGPTLMAFYGGAVVIEMIFRWPGMGRLLLDSLTARDYPVVMASVVIGSILTILGYMISDILYALFDPRVRLG